MILTITPNTAIDRAIEVADFRVGGTMKGRVVAVLPAGKGVNISRTLSALGKPSVATGFVGRGDQQQFVESLAGTRATVDLVPVREPTRVDTTVIDPVNSTVTHVREQGFLVDGDDLARLYEKLDALLPRASTVVVAGSLPPGMEPTALTSLIDQCRGKGRRVCVDTSGRALAAAVEHGCGLVKPNAEELSEICGARPATAAEAAEQARKLLATVGIVIVSLGSDGAVCVTREQAWAAAAPVAPARVVNTVGCGDAFLAGFCGGLDDGEDLDECLRRAVACGSACTLTSESGSIQRQEFEAMYATTRTVRL